MKLLLIKIFIDEVEIPKTQEEVAACRIKREELAPTRKKTWAAIDALRQELDRKELPQWGSGGGSGWYGIYLQADDPAVNRQVIADVVGHIAPDLPYTIEDAERQATDD
jgi:hypothetical protein